MTNSRALGLYVPGHPWGIGQPFISRKPPVLTPRTPRHIGDLVQARFAVPENPILRGYGLAGLGCSGGCGLSGSTPSAVLGSGFSMTNMKTDFSNMMSGAASMGTYALYGGVVLGALVVLPKMFGGRRR